ncbi:MAG: ABC transporter permease [Clostridia bacterium]|nr:ABC transporter permease [Clostridia bacterium]
MDKVLNAIFSASFLFSVIRITTPLMFGAMGALICKQGGVLHIAFEATMLFAAFFGMAASAFTNSLWLALLAGVAGGVLTMLLLGYFTLMLDANVVLTGIALNTLASGGTVFLMYLLCGEKGTSNALQSLTFPNVDIPILKDIPFLGEVLSGHNVLTYVAFILPIFVYILVFKTPLGLRMRTVGESPNAASSVGLNVNRIKFITLAIGGAVTSLGGLYMSMGYLSWFARDMIAGRGFMAIAAQNLGNAAVLPTFITSIGFGIANALAITLQTLSLPAEIFQALPYAVTLIGLAAYSSSLKKGYAGRKIKGRRRNNA